HDRAMPEEHNRVVADHLSDVCCAPTEVNVSNLMKEGITEERIVQTGNTVVEAVRALLPSPEDRRALLREYGVEPGRFILSTFHRPENVDDPQTYRTILEQLASLPMTVVLPLHPRSVRRAEEHGLGDLLAELQVVEPIGYRDFLGLEAESGLLISDSGGVQEEASIVKRPLIVVRNSTERPEVIGTFARRVLPGPGITAEATEIIATLGAVHAELADIPSPYGDGTASEKSLAAIR
ncbi:MAG: UDP-N-acetylglucosamine 2-epimerase, partial [Halobacteriales archaeon]|nr:UDP-N-acetylglucosamine 2-epimerase [Halobacteriales archaeon]